MVSAIHEPTVQDTSWIFSNRRLSQSLLWRLQKTYYQNKGIAAWSNSSVPHYITNNPFIASAYARVVFGFLRDCLTQTKTEQVMKFPLLNPAEPVIFLELGAGTGRFAYHFLKYFLPHLAQSGLNGVKVKYVLTDIAEKNLAFMRQHERLQPFIESGQLDFAVFDPVHDTQIALMVSNQVLAPGELHNPLVVIANYFFDSLPVDAFSFQEGALLEEQVRFVGSEGETAAAGEPLDLARLTMKYESRYCGLDYYEDADENQLLQQYTRFFRHNQSLTYPCGGITCLRGLLKLSAGWMMVLAGDRGYYRQEDLNSQNLPEFSIHDHCVSLPVNFHALGQYIRLKGGQAYHSQVRDGGLVFAAYLCGGLPGNDVETRLAFQQSIEEIGPDDFFSLKKTLESEYARMTLPQLLALLRISGYDENIFAGCISALMERIPDASSFEQERLFDAACKVWDLYYPINEAYNFPKEISRLFIRLEAYAEAADCLQAAKKWHSEDAENDALLQVCQEHPCFDFMASVENMDS